MASPEETMAANRQRYLINPGSVTRFPSEEIPYKILINFKDYSYTASQGGLIDSGSNVKQMDAGSVILPLPLQLNDTTSISADQTNAGIAAGISALANQGLSATELSSMTQGTPEQNWQAYSKLISQGGLALAAAGSQLKGGLGTAAKIAGSLLGTAGEIGKSDTTALLSGQVTNSFETMQFKGVKLKQHAFNWRLSPSNSTDSERLRTIINQIKANILPSYIAVGGPSQYGSHALQQYPKIAFISFYGIDQEYYYKLKPSIITQFSVRYNGGEQLNIYRGGKPAVVDISMELTELISHSSDDYGRSASISASDYTNAMNVKSNLGALGGNR